MIYTGKIINHLLLALLKLRLCAHGDKKSLLATKQVSNLLICGFFCVAVDVEKILNQNSNL